MRKLDRDTILAIADYRVEAVDVPEWAGQVHVRTLSARDREAFERRYAEDKSNFVTRLVAATLCDEAGSPLFTDVDVEALGGKSFRAINRIFDAALKLNALSDAAVEDAEKN
jgi:hypothetical protein